MRENSSLYDQFQSSNTGQQTANTQASPIVPSTSALHYNNIVGACNNYNSNINLHNHHLTNSANVNLSSSTSSLSNTTLHSTPSVANTEFLSAENYGYHNHHQNQPHQQIQNNLKTQIGFNSSTIANHSNTPVNGSRTTTTATATTSTDSTLAQYLISNSSIQNTSGTPTTTGYTNENYSTPYYNNHIQMDTWPRYMTSDCK